MADARQALFLLVLLAVVFFLPLVFHPGQVLYSDHSDLLAMHLPMKRFLVRSFQETGELPLWNPYSFGGMPFIHDVQVAAFYPLHAPLYLLPEDWIGPALSWLVVLHAMVAGCCAYAYARHRGLVGLPAWVVALGYMFAGKWLLHVLDGGHYIMTPLAWLPLVLLFLEQAIKRRSWARACAAGVVYALIVLGTHPQMTLYAGLFAGVWSLGAAADGVAGRGVWRSALRLWFGAGLATVFVAVLLSAVQLLPALEAAPEASRSGGVAPRDILAAAGPSLFGLFGPGLTSAWREDRGGVAVLWLAAAVIAPLIGNGRIRFEAGVLAGLFVFSLGGAVLVQALPGFRLFQIPGRMLILAALPVAFLAGRTCRALETGTLTPALRSQAVRWLVGILALSLALTAWAAVLAWREAVGSGLLGPFDVRALVYWLVVPVLAAALAWLLLRATRHAALIFSFLLLADAWTLARPHVAVRPEAAIYPLSESVRYLIQQRQANRHDYWRVLDRGVPGAPSSAPLGAAQPMLGDVRLEPVLGYNTFDVRRYKEFLQFVLDHDGPVRPREGVFGFPIADAFPIRNKRLLDLLGARFLLQPETMPAGFDAAGEPGRDAGWRRVLIDRQPVAYSFLEGGVRALPPFAVYENVDRFPRIFLVTAGVPLADRSTVLTQMNSTDFKSTVLVESPEETKVPGRDGQPGAGGRAEITAAEPNRITVECAATGAAYLVLTDPWFPGWKATVNGTHAELYRADYTFRAVRVPAGNSTVVFDFRPTYYELGKAITGGSLIALLAAAAVAMALHVRKRRLRAHDLADQGSQLSLDPPAPLR